MNLRNLKRNYPSSKNIEIIYHLPDTYFLSLLNLSFFEEKPLFPPLPTFSNSALIQGR